MDVCVKLSRNDPCPRGLLPTVTVTTPRAHFLCLKMINFDPYACLHADVFFWEIEHLQLIENSSEVQVSKGKHDWSARPPGHSRTDCPWLKRVGSRTINSFYPSAMILFVTLTISLAIVAAAEADTNQL